MVPDNDTTKEIWESIENLFSILGILSTLDWTKDRIKKLYERFRKRGKHERK